MGKCLIFVVAVLAICSQALAADFKLGIVDTATVIQKSEPGQKAMGQIEGEFKGMKEDLNRKSDEIKKLKEDLETKHLAYTDEAKQEKELDLKRRLRDFEDTAQGYQRKMRVEQDKLAKPIVEQLKRIIDDYGKKNGYALIIDAQGGGVLFADQGVNITNQIMAELNRSWRDNPGASSSSSPSSSAPAAPSKPAKKK